MPHKILILIGLVLSVAFFELRLTWHGVSKDELQELGIDFTDYPPWHLLWPQLMMDVFCRPLGCRFTWRQYLPFDLGKPGHWFSEEYEISLVDNLMPGPLTFEKFRSLQGYNVTEGSGLLAGLHSTSDIEEWSKSLHEYMFETPTTSLSILTTPMALWMIFLLVLCIKVFKAVVMPQFEKIGRQLALQAHGEAWLENHQERIMKFAEYVYRLLYHSFISLVGCYLFWNAPWWNEEMGGTRNLYTDWLSYPVSPSMTWYYLCQAAYNVDAMVSLLQISFQIHRSPKDSSLPITLGWANTVRGDFNEMLAHHIVTNWLVFMSSYLMQTRVGSMVFWMHDISDVPVDLAKLANFVKWKNGTIAFFFVLCVAWAYTRLYVLPFTIWSSIFFHGQEAGRGLNVWPYFYAYQPIFVALLAALIVLHGIWFSMFIRMAYLLVTRGETHDLTEHKQGEKQHGSTTSSPIKSSSTSNGTAAAAVAVTTNGINGKSKVN